MLCLCLTMEVAERDFHGLPPSDEQCLVFHPLMSSVSIPKIIKLRNKKKKDDTALCAARRSERVARIPYGKRSLEALGVLDALWCNLSCIWHPFRTKLFENIL